MDPSDVRQVAITSPVATPLHAGAILHHPLLYNRSILLGPEYQRFSIQPGVSQYYTDTMMHANFSFNEDYSQKTKDPNTFQDGDNYKAEKDGFENQKNARLQTTAGERYETIQSDLTVPKTMFNFSDGGLTGFIPSTMNFPMVASIMPQTADGNMIMNPLGLVNDSSMGLNIASTSVSGGELIQSDNCIVYPTGTNNTVRTPRERPLGCKTIFVGNLPDTITEAILRDVFRQCGEITSVRLNSKKFSHIRFSNESAADAAVGYNGYGVQYRLPNGSFTMTRISVDYAQSREDDYDYECKQRRTVRRERHRERGMVKCNCLVDDKLKCTCKDRPFPSNSPPFVNYYTENEANNILEKLKGEDSRLDGISTVVTWLNRGECNKRNVNTFYSIIQSANSHVRKLLMDKHQMEDQFKRAKDIMKCRAKVILQQFGQIEKLFASSSHKKVWDHFTKAQRKHMEEWKKKAEELKELETELGQTTADEMDLSDSEHERNAKKAKALNDELIDLRDKFEKSQKELSVCNNIIEERKKQVIKYQKLIQKMRLSVAETKRIKAEQELKIMKLEALLDEKHINRQQVNLSNDDDDDDDCKLDDEVEIINLESPVPESDNNSDIEMDISNESDASACNKFK